jgi:N-acetylglucosaminyldiphosphoundecaprenol N-acetyl-beta-D-mannosaminyltransferase
VSELLSQPSTRLLAGVRFMSASRGSILASVIDVAVTKHRQGKSLHLVNSYNLSIANKDEKYRSLLNSSWGCIPDGKPLQVLTSMSNQKLIQYRGPDLFRDVLEAGRQRGLRHYFLGSTPQTLELLLEKLRSGYSGLIIAGSHSPSFSDATNAQEELLQERINSCSPDIVWVALGTPKQDFEAERLARIIPTLFVTVGAAFDFYAQTKREAPNWISKIGLEWLHRLVSEPRRLWRRYLVGNFGFLISVLRNRRLQ